MKVIYTSWISTKLQKSEDLFDLPPSLFNIADLIEWLGQKQGLYGSVFANKSVIYACTNNHVIEHDTPLSGIKEVVLFAPIAGG